MLVAVTCVHNESYYLPGFLRHIERYVDGIVALDDGSTDSTVDMLQRNPKVLEVIRKPHHDSPLYDETANRAYVLRKARELGASWVLCCDPDERFETRFLEALPNLIRHEALYGLHFRELWEIEEYRCDGIWDEKTKWILFPLADEMSFSYPYKIHSPWHYDALADRKELTEYNLYHLKMIRPEDREARRRLYNDLDPDRLIQPIGYDYLVDETGIELKAIPPGRAYDTATIPRDLARTAGGAKRATGAGLAGLVRRMFSRRE